MFGRLQHFVQTRMSWLHPVVRCVVCDGCADRRRGNVRLCRACFEASRPYTYNDPYDVIGGSD